jgi:hypothetical protein
MLIAFLKPRRAKERTLNHCAFSLSRGASAQIGQIVHVVNAIKD